MFRDGAISFFPLANLTLHSTCQAHAYRAPAPRSAAGLTAQSGLMWDEGIDQQPQDVQAILAASWQS